MSAYFLKHHLDLIGGNHDAQTVDKIGTQAADNNQQTRNEFGIPFPAQALNHQIIGSNNHQRCSDQKQPGLQVLIGSKLLDFFIKAVIQDQTQPYCQ